MGLLDKIKKSLADDVSNLIKIEGNPNSVPQKEDVAFDANGDEKIGHKAFLSDPYWDVAAQSTYYKNKSSRLSNKTLKDVSLRDWLVSSIIQARCDTLLSFSRVQHDRFKRGFRFVMQDPKAEMTDADRANIANLEQFIYHTGRLDEHRPTDSKMLFGEFIKKTLRDALTVGHISIEKVKTRGGSVHRFMPLPAESVYLASQSITKNQIDDAIKSGKGSVVYRKPNNPENDSVVHSDNQTDYVKYIQMSVDQLPLASFDDSTMIFKLFNPQNFMDSMGYCYSPLELAIINVTNHLNVENYNANFFTHGYAARGVLHLKGTVTQSQLVAFRRQFYNQINGTQNAWRTPIIAGLDEVQWVPLSGTNKEMEYINFNNHIMRCICTQFQIDPLELGLDYLTSATGRSSGNQQSNEHKIEYSRERGLHPILMFYEDFINCDLVPSIDMELAKKYRFEFVGYEDETPQTQVAQMQAEMSVHASINDLLIAAQKQALKDKDGNIIAGSNLPLNQSFWALVEKNYTRGEIREIFFGDKDASKRKELQYIPGDPAFLQWSQLLVTLDQQKKNMQAQQQQVEAQAQQQQNEQAKTDAEHAREQEKHAMEMEQAKNAAAHSAVNASSFHDTAQKFGATKADAGRANPINKLNE